MIQKIDQMHYQRLRRHYHDSVKTYDQISFLDLSHSLRMWTELKMKFDAIEDIRLSKYFKTAIPIRKAIKAARGSDYVFAYMPGGVVTYASDGQIASLTNVKVEKYSLGVSVRKAADHIELKNFSYVSKPLEEPARNALSKEKITKLNHSHWLGAEAVRLACHDHQNPIEPIHISRETIIKRVANTLDGSHPSSSSSTEYDNKYDTPIQFLLDFEMGGIPLPYFILLKIAQDIITTIPKILPGIERP